MAHFVILFFTYFHKNKTHDNTYKVLQKKKKNHTFLSERGEKSKKHDLWRKKFEAAFSNDK